MSGSAEPEGVDWQWVERLVALCQHTQAVLPETKSALKGALRSADARTVLVTLTAVDSVAINTNREVRAQLATKGWMRLLSGLAGDASPVALAAAQILSNWQLMFKGEELGAAAYSACRALQVREEGAVPPPTHFAYQMREIVEQEIPMIGLQRGTDFLAAFAAPAGAGRQAGSAGSADSGRRWHSAPPHAPPAASEASSAGNGGSVHAQPGGRAAEMRAGAARLAQCLERGQTAEAAGWADCCREWRQEIRACVAEDVTDDALAALLDANDALNAALRLWQQAQARSEAAQQSSPAPEAPGAGAGAGRTPPAQAATGAPYRPEQHSQWYSPLESSLPGQAPTLPAMVADSSGSPEATSRPAAAAAPASSGADARARADATPPADGVAAPDWLVRGPAPLIDLLSWHEPSEPAAGTPAATAPAGVPARAAARRGAASSGEKPASTARSRPSSVPARSEAAAARWAAPGLGNQAGSARGGAASPYEQPTAPPEADPTTPLPGWQAFGADAGLLDAELQRLRAELRARDAEVARLRGELLKHARPATPPARRPSEPALGHLAAEPAGAAVRVHRSTSEPPAAMHALPLRDLASMAYSRQPALRVRFQPGQLEEVAARLQARGLARRPAAPALV